MKKLIVKYKQLHQNWGNSNWRELIDWYFTIILWKIYLAAVSWKIFPSPFFVSMDAILLNCYKKLYFLNSTFLPIIVFWKIWKRFSLKTTKKTLLIHLKNSKDRCPLQYIALLPCFRILRLEKNSFQVTLVLFQGANIYIQLRAKQTTPLVERKF